jgi:hypothetical protein
MRFAERRWTLCEAVLRKSRHVIECTAVLHSSCVSKPLPFSDHWNDKKAAWCMENRHEKQPISAKTPALGEGFIKTSQHNPRVPAVLPNSISWISHHTTPLGSWYQCIQRSQYFLAGEEASGTATGVLCSCGGKGRVEEAEEILYGPTSHSL